MTKKRDAIKVSNCSWKKKMSKQTNYEQKWLSIQSNTKLNYIPGQHQKK